MKKLLAILSILVLGVTFVPGGDPKGKGHGDGDHVMLRPDAIKWGPAPPALPPGAQVAVLSGDPTKSGMYTLRAKLPDGYKVALHTHPTDENVTVLKGTFIVSTLKGTETVSATLPEGSFMHMPKGMKHAATAKGETIIQVHGTGPFEIDYVNPKDDPRKK